MTKPSNNPSVGNQHESNDKTVEVPADDAVLHVFSYRPLTNEDEIVRLKLHLTDDRKKSGRQWQSPKSTAVKMLFRSRLPLRSYLEKALTYISYQLLRRWRRARRDILTFCDQRRKTRRLVGSKLSCFAGIVHPHVFGICHSAAAAIDERELWMPSQRM